ncbi:hypothetical protein SAMN05444280_1382 [Tangfeifania diversioriginum]|uniref:Uncharacterized protein n=1 Tax=Tangfeifania diversioriginum TaxID=1168035 RepID=A0A1M6N0D9_9BACT|nr:hypothetical protein [Tangfeifania diversioriginum]SHJ89093.1 hypothetical protein SAMN05444280_1382 [Tangfeifania diversioriginum]
MKLKHRYLEQVRRNPQSVKQILQETSGGGKTMVRCWDRAIGHYHKNEDSKSALSYLNSALSNFNDNRTNNVKKDMLIEKFNNYTHEYLNLDFKNIKVNSRINIDIHHNNYLTGEIFRVDQTPENGFAITLMNRNDEIWATELRFRILQIYYSNIYKCPYDLIKVGVFNFEEELHEYTSFDEIELNQAWQEIIDISNKINKFSF